MNTFSYIYPPRPAFTIPPFQVDRYNYQNGYLSQYKYNGSRILLFKHNHMITFYDRHAKRIHGLEKVEMEIIRYFPKLAEYDYACLDGELLNKTKDSDYKDSIVFFDILALGENFAFGPDQEKRLDILRELVHNGEQCELGLKIAPGFFLAETFKNDFSQKFDVMPGEVEGLVIRETRAKLGNFGAAPYDANWMIRCRKTHKNYHF